MLEKLKKINMKTTVLMAICFYSLTILIHVLIISGIIPLTWVNGGRSESFATQLPISIINILISINGGVFTLIVGGNILYKYKRGITVILTGSLEGCKQVNNIQFRTSNNIILDHQLALQFAVLFCFKNKECSFLTK